MTPKTTTLTWLRRDLRLQDNPALAAASQMDRSYVVYIDEISSVPKEDWQPGAASQWWLHRSLEAFSQQVEKLGSRLMIAKGSPLKVLCELVEQLAITHIFWNRRYEKRYTDQDASIKAALLSQGVVVKSFSGRYLLEPWLLTNLSGQPYKVFTPFSRAFLKLDFETPPLPMVKKLSLPPTDIAALPLTKLHLMPKLSWYQTMEECWQPGEIGANKILKNFAKNAVSSYQAQRDLPATVGTSRLSAHLHFGEISVRSIWYQLTKLAENQTQLDVFPYLRQLIWREFANYSLFHFPSLPDTPIRKEFKAFPWADNKRHLLAWQKGMTGYPLVDAGMRELWATGWMHNRVRMIVGSFLVKNLRINWLAGEKWFWDTLVDADLPNNSMGWQWVAGCGIDAAPYFRIFNPTLQGEKFDPDGKYIRRWLPELGRLPKKWIHRPSEAPTEVLQGIGLVLGKDYPKPIIDYKKSRQDALDSYQSLR